MKYAEIADEPKWNDYYNSNNFTDAQNATLKDIRETFRHFHNDSELSDELLNSYFSISTNLTTNNSTEKNDHDNEAKWNYLETIAIEYNPEECYIYHTDSEKELNQILMYAIEYKSIKEYQIKLNDEIQTAIKQMTDIIFNIRNLGLNLETYKTTADLIYCFKEFLKPDDERIIFQHYFLRGQMFIDEMEKFLCLFEDYILRIKEMQIKVEHMRTVEGANFA